MRLGHRVHGVDVRSIRYPGLISWKTLPGGGTTDYAVEIFHEALKARRYTSFLGADTRLPMMYMPDAIRATLELTEAPAGQIRERHGYNLGGVSFAPTEIASVRLCNVVCPLLAGSATRRSPSGGCWDRCRS